MTATEIAEWIKREIQYEAAKHIAESPAPNRRAYNCAAPGCNRHAYAKGFCNAHYIRARAGRSMDEPLKSRKRLGVCIECGNPTNKNGGLGRCKRHYVRFRTATIKRICVQALGGQCARCKGVYPACVFDFHHPADKSFSVGNAFNWASMDKIADEVSRCELLCANCHRMEHAYGSLRSSVRDLNRS